MGSQAASHAPFIAAPGATEFIRTGIHAIRSDAINYNSSSPVSLFSLPAECIVTGVAVEVITAFDGTIPSLAVGISGTTGRHAETTDIDLTATGLQPVSKPYHYTASASIIGTLVAGGGATAGKAYVWLYYRPNADITYSQAPA